MYIRSYIHKKKKKKKIGVIHRIEREIINKSRDITPKHKRSDENSMRNLLQLFIIFCYNRNKKTVNRKKQSIGGDAISHLPPTVCTYTSCISNRKCFLTHSSCLLPGNLEKYEFNKINSPKL